MKRLFALFLLFIYARIPAQNLSASDSLQFARFEQKITRLLEKEKTDKALQITDSAIEQYKQAKNIFLLVKTRILKSRAMRSKGQFEKALEYSLKTLQLADKFNLEPLQADILFELGNIYRYIGQKNKALESLTKALVLYETKDNQQGLGKTYTLLGVLHTELGKFDKGQSYLQKALNIYRKLQDKKMIRKTWMGIGYGYFNEGKYHAAKKYFLKILYDLPPDDFYTRNYLYLNLATIYQRLKQLDSAYYYQLQAVKLAEKNRDDYTLATLYYNASTVKLQQKQPDSARYFAQKGLQKAQKVKYYDRIIKNYLILQQLDSLSGKPLLQIEKLHRIIQLKDTILHYERQSIAKEMKTKYAAYKKDEIISLQQKNLQILKEKNQFLTGLIILGIGLFIILLLLAYTYRKLLKKNKILYQIEKEKIIQQLKNKEQELVAIALQIEQKNKLINKFYQKLKKAELSEKNRREEVQNILKEVKLSLNIQKDVELFSEKFGDLHHDFISKLKKEYPQLSLKEIKFLSFIKVGLSTKQIAAMQNVTPAAVHKMKYRIKKKLGFVGEKSLDDFVMNL